MIGPTGIAIVGQPPQPAQITQIPMMNGSVGPIAIQPNAVQENTATAAPTTNNATQTPAAVTNSGSTNANSSTDSSTAENGMPLDQLKQMLSTQLDYYFSR